MKKFLVLTLICLAFCVKANAVYVPTQLYMFAFGRSFNDSIVYISDLQTVDSTWLDNRHGFLYSRSTYSYQFKNYMSELGVENPTTCVIFSAKLKKAEKAYLKLKKKYTKTPGEWEVNFVSINDFAFEAISVIDDTCLI